METAIAAVSRTNLDFTQSKLRLELIAHESNFGGLVRQLLQTFRSFECIRRISRRRADTGRRQGDKKLNFAVPAFFQQSGGVVDGRASRIRSPLHQKGLGQNSFR